jgi:Zn-dependent protease
MITGKEITGLLLALIVLAFANSFINLTLFINSLIIFAVILIVYVTAKKLTAYYYEAEEESKIWTFQRYGLYERSYFKTPVPIGIILPFLLSILSFGYIKWFAVTESEIKPTPERAVKRDDIFSFSEMTEYHLAVISAAGIFFSLLISPIAYILNFPELTRAGIYFASFNMLPLGKLDGSRIFYGSRILWTVLAVLCLMGLGYAFFLA